MGELDDLFKPMLKHWSNHSGEEGARVGCALVCLQSDRRWELDGHKRFVPASNNKIWTTLMALNKLGPEYRWITKFGIQGGTLYIQGGGDPSFDEAAAFQVAQSFKKQGVNKLQGPVILDDKRHQDAPWGTGWMWDDLSQGYCAPVHALIMERNRITFHLNPSLDQPQIQRISPRLCQAWAKVNLHWSDDKDAEPNIFQRSGSGQYRLEGEVFRGDPMVQVAVASGPNFFAEVFLNVMRECGINVSENIQVIPGSFPDQVDQIMLWKSAPLKSILPWVNQDSDNLVAEILLRSLSLNDQNNLSLHEGIQRLRQGWEEESVRPPDAFVDGSGLSMYNLSTPNALLEALIWACQEHPWFSVWINSLACYGHSGTLKDRKMELPEKVKVVAKTGSLTGVKSLSGYFLFNGEPAYAFSLLINGLLNEKNGEQLQDQFIKLVASTVYSSS
ncbi:D-alanyl-D-alanine carboxypeptidase/D-alanyl-D-alanine endopeptidase [Melghirimyces algeriensis]|uniref:D-alanyl-D-alanine carboxypeptidase / D-alanyl-D-alanine-endopeptidase (Penicillin-binding protein 4) n=1 Tax=Melghirimyces algeriensis TaxID=910412 RepID=A0A521BT46_9BACL|nr:D-alanyl-D-alanine carboxypeptidase/D-alanyl-D-alanine-endopeptidase [Melghirimyces algeriensis]SMO49740.1 D-alanyl-D-alanine carboxypeptidase / D-alanyl-D-alanine-endopeptidase (penicillin-binding protein 4) [Melghirimyces algeriensis]